MAVSGRNAILMMGATLTLGSCCSRPPGSSYPARARLASVALVEENCPAAPGAVLTPADSTRLTRAAASDEAERAMVGELLQGLFHASEVGAGRQDFDQYKDSLNGLARARSGLTPTTAGAGGEAVRAVVPAGPGKILVYPAPAVGALGADLQRGNPSFERFLATAQASPCRVRVERQFVPEPIGSTPGTAAMKPTSFGGGTAQPPPSGWALDKVNYDRAAALLAARHPGQRAGDGVVVVQLDTGYTPNCQFWDAARSFSPLHPEKGFDYFDGKADPLDSLIDGPLESRQPGHGTKTGTTFSSPHDAGSLGRCAPTQADDAVRGMAPGVVFVPARVTDGIVLGLPPGLKFAFPPLDHRLEALGAAALAAATGTGPLPRAQILTMSLGGADCNCDDAERQQRRELEQKLETAEAAGLLVVAAAGQYPGAAKFLRLPLFGGKRPVTFPGRWPSTIAVAATDSLDHTWKETARGPEVDVAAPGVDVWRAETTKDAQGALVDGVGVGSGTSFSTALVAGLGALWIQAHGYEELHGCYQGALNSTFRYVLRHGGSRQPSGWKTGEYGAGIVDAAGLLSAALPTPASVCAAEKSRRTAQGWDRICAFTRAAPVPAACASLGVAGAGSARKTETEAIHRAALDHPDDEAAFARYTATLPRAGAYYVVEGDVRLTEDELRDDLRRRGQPAGPPPRGGELKLNQANGVPTWWKEPESRRLTYAVDRRSFPHRAEYDRVVTNLSRAARDWEEACRDCGITFTHVREKDDAPEIGSVTFVARYFDWRGEYVALGFFPNQAPANRTLDIDPSYFKLKPDGYDPVGVLRHELGHILGYRHEHVQGFLGCYQETDGNWSDLTPYDSRSVMHYFCGPRGSLKLAISDCDRCGHQNLYGATKCCNGTTSCTDGGVSCRTEP